jgi:hypothetical protein
LLRPLRLLLPWLLLLLLLLALLLSGLLDQPVQVRARLLGQPAQVRLDRRRRHGG